jgi:hypothetical protein
MSNHTCDLCGKGYDDGILPDDWVLVPNDDGGQSLICGGCNDGQDDLT